MRIAEIMTPQPITIETQATAQAAAKIMRDHDLGSLPVIDGERLVGFLTDRDIAVRCVARGSDSSKERVDAIMSPDLVCCNVDQPPEEVLELMATRQVQRLPVVDAEERLVGIVNTGKLAESCDKPDAVCETIRAVRQPITAG